MLAMITLMTQSSEEIQKVYSLFTDSNKGPSDPSEFTDPQYFCVTNTRQCKI